jgi:hypothetical protein
VLDSVEILHFPFAVTQGKVQNDMNGKRIEILHFSFAGTERCFTSFRMTEEGGGFG